MAGWGPRGVDPIYSPPITHHDFKISISFPSSSKHRQRPTGFEYWFRQTHVGATIPGHGEPETRPQPWCWHPRRWYPALSKRCSNAQSVSPVESTSSTTTTDVSLGTTSRSISICFCFEISDPKDEIYDGGLMTETVGGGSLPASRTSTNRKSTRKANADA